MTARITLPLRPLSILGLTLALYGSPLVAEQLPLELAIREQGLSSALNTYRDTADLTATTRKAAPAPELERLERLLPYHRLIGRAMSDMNSSRIAVGPLDTQPTADTAVTATTTPKVVQHDDLPPPAQPHS